MRIIPESDLRSEASFLLFPICCIKWDRLWHNVTWQVRCVTGSRRSRLTPGPEWGRMFSQTRTRYSGTPRIGSCSPLPTCLRLGETGSSTRRMKSGLSLSRTRSTQFDVLEETERLAGAFHTWQSAQSRGWGLVVTWCHCQSSRHKVICARLLPFSLHKCPESGKS